LQRIGSGVAKPPADAAETIKAYENRIRELEDRLARANESLEAIARGDVEALVMLDAAAQRHSQTIGRADRTYRIVMEQIREGAFTVNTDGEILYHNGRFGKMLDAPEGGLVGRRLQDFIGPDGLAAFERLLESARDDSVDGEFTMRGMASTEIPVSCSLHPYWRVQGDRLVCGVVTDLSEQRSRLLTLLASNERLHAATAQRAASEEALRQNQKLAAVGQLTGGLAHDFNNLLAVIMGSLEMMRAELGEAGPAAGGAPQEADRPRDPDVLREHLAAALGSTRRGAAVTQRLLTFARRQPLAPKRLDVNPVIDGIADLLRKAAGPGIAVSLALAPDAGATMCDANHLENAVLNLAINARDAMPAGGELTITTARVCLDAETAASRGLAEGPYIAVAVTDTGTGMPAEVIAHAFDPFFTTKPAGEGTGLGLSMIHDFARQSGGAVRIHSIEQVGTTVTIYLPCSAAAEIPAAEFADVEALATRHDPPRPAAAAPLVQGGETVLLVDDEPDLRVLFARRLRRQGFVVIEASDGEAALAALRDADRVDLLVTDIGLPGRMSGHQLAEAGRRMRDDLKVLFITGFAAAGVADDPPLPAGVEVMHKPFEIEALAGTIRKMIGAADVA